PGKFQKQEDVDPDLDLLINVGIRSGVGCRRMIFEKCFDNSAADTDHLECNMEMAEGCDRCHVKKPAICCDLHNPAEFLSYTSTITKQRRTAQCSWMPAYTKQQHDYSLENALLDWREAKTAEVYGRIALSCHGPSLIMTDATLDFVVDYAHHDKIHTAENLRRETGWTRSNQFGDEVIGLIQLHAPPRPSPFVSTPLQSNGITLNTPSVNQTLASPSSVVKQRNKCSACGQVGHNGKQMLVCL
ncbi:hypothetical protein EV363DRAFT_1170892, partial [Boletus edulis]